MGVIFHYIIWIIVHPRLVYINPDSHFVFVYAEAAAAPGLILDSWAGLTFLRSDNITENLELFIT